MYPLLPSDRLPTVDTRAGPTVGCITPLKWLPNTNGARLYIYTMQQRLIYQPGPTHAYETRWTCVATANPFWPLTVKPNMRVPSSTWVEPTKIRLGYWLKWAPTSYPPKLVTYLVYPT